MRIALPQLGQDLEFNKISRALRVQAPKLFHHQVDPEAKRVLQSEGMWDISLSFKPKGVEMQVEKSTSITAWPGAEPLVGGRLSQCAGEVGQTMLCSVFGGGYSRGACRPGARGGSPELRAFEDSAFSKAEADEVAGGNQRQHFS